jgi:glutamyl-tRNA reductase
MDDLYLLHRKTSNPPLVASDQLMVWSTCLRQIGISREPFHSHDLQESDEVYSSTEALQFLLEVICGLHSPLIGETEVQGQFRQFLQVQKDHALNAGLQSTWQKILNQSKLMRDKYLCKSGAQGYGSLSRQMLSPLPPEASVAILGSGHLTQEILPWLQETKQITVFARSPEKARAQIESVEIRSLDQLSQQKFQALIIAAPISNEQIAELLSQSKFEILLDLRGGDCNFDGQPWAEKFYDLKMCHAILHSQMQNRIVKKENALRAIQIWKEQLRLEVQVRPFGWEDLCG